MISKSSPAAGEATMLMMLMQQSRTEEAKPPESAPWAEATPTQPLSSLPGRKTLKRPNYLCRESGTGGASLPPDQVTQHCPRCNSLNTKFCYYNNYSLSQPRHFCKDCRRYWTKGGTLRNVPVGGGCRKNKRSALIKERSVGALMGSMVHSLDDSTDKSIANVTAISNDIPCIGALASLMSDYYNPNGYNFINPTVRFTHSDLRADSQASFFGPRPPSSTLPTLPKPSLFNCCQFDTPLPSFNFQCNPSSSGKGITAAPLIFNEPTLMNSCVLDPQASNLHPLLQGLPSPPATSKLENHLSMFSGSALTEERLHHGRLCLPVGAEQNLDEIGTRTLLGSCSCVDDDNITSNNLALMNGRTSPTSRSGLLPSLGDYWTPAGGVLGLSAAGTNPGDMSLWTATWTEMHAALAGEEPTMAAASLPQQ